MKQKDIDKLAIKRASENFPNGQKFRIENRIDHFVNGQLLVITYEELEEDDYVDEESYAYFSNDSLTFFADVNELAHGLGNLQSSGFTVRLLDTVSITGIIAVIITIVVSYLAIMSKQIPEILGSSLTMILGFYFGTKVKVDAN